MMDILYQNKINGVTYLQNSKNIFFAYQDSPHFSLLCEFNIEKIEEEFCTTKTYCQYVSEYNQAAIFKSKCDSPKYYNTTQNQKKWKESFVSVSGNMIPEKSFRGSYGILFSSDRQLYISREDQLIKTGNNITNNLKDIHHQNDKMLTLWDSKNGIVYVDPFTKNTVGLVKVNSLAQLMVDASLQIFIKEIVCNDSCTDILHITNVKCNLCDKKFPTVCNFEETQIYCGPLWEKIIDKNIVNLNGTKMLDSKTLLIIYNGVERKMECSPIKDKKPHKCSRYLDAYLSPHFSAPLSSISPEVDDTSKILKLSVIISLIASRTFVGFCILFACLYRWHQQKLRKNRKGRKPYMDALLNNENLVIFEKRGSGHSSYVSRGEYTNVDEIQTVAVKTLQCSRADVIKEIEALRSAKHENVVTFLGWMEMDDEMRIITEYMSGGDLHIYLINPNKLLLISSIFSYIFQALDAMVYLSHKHILHRDLAARNCLLNETFEILKIGDFGLARPMNIDYEYLPEASRVMPFRWMPLEALKNEKFTLKGDIWSFAVLIWEIFERGAYPYKNLNVAEVIDFIGSGKRLPCPEYCPLELYTVMLWCWDEKPIDRPNFDAIKDDIKTVYSHLKLYEPDRLSITIEAEGYPIPKTSQN